MTLPSLPQWMSVAVSTFAGGAVGDVQQHLANGVPPTNEWRGIAIGAAIAGLIAVTHLYQPSPAPKKEQVAS